MEYFLSSYDITFIRKRIAKLDRKISKLDPIYNMKESLQRERRMFVMLLSMAEQKEFEIKISG
jgi:hypothetical protein